MKKNTKDLKAFIEETVKDNIPQGKAIKAIVTSRENLFITGKGGTGKSFFLRKMKEFVENCAVVAPTGIAAVNVGGTTVHSFFRLPIAPYIPKIEKGKMVKSWKECSKDPNFKKKICKLDTLIIDEVSMLRADILDRVSDVLMNIRGKNIPFGGVRLVMFGDLNQLPPVVTGSEGEVFKEYYDSPYFFSSKSLRLSGFSMIEFDKMYRQKDQVFIDLLNDIRVGVITEKDQELLDSRIMPIPDNFDGIRLCSHNSIAQTINDEMIKKQSGKEYIFDAITSGTPPKNVPCEDRLVIKVGCQVILGKNDDGYYNGSSAVVTSVHEDEGAIEVKVLATGRSHTIFKEVWDNIEYGVSNGHLIENKIGYKSQFPMKPGYAISIHKCIDEDSLVFTKRGLVKIKNIVVGDEVNIGNGSYRKVLDKIDSGNMDTIKIITKSGYEISCTPDHKILDSDLNFKKSGDFHIGDYIPISRKVEICDIDTNNLSLDWLIGYIIGDGSYGLRSKSKSRIDICVGGTPRNVEAYNNLKSCLDKMDIPYHVYTKKTRGEKGFEYNFVIENIKFRTDLISMGLGYDTKENKKIPYYIYESSLQQKSDFIRGMFDSDGCVKKNGHIVLSQSNFDIVRSIQVLLLEFGIISSIYKQNVLNHRDSYHLYIRRSSYSNFKKYVNFSFCTQRNILDSIPDDKERRMDFIPNIDLFKKECKYNSHIKRNLSSCSSLNYQTVRMADGLTPYFEKIINNDYFFDTIKSIEYNGVKHTYDIEVDTDHHFVSGGVICSNSQGMTFDKAMIDASRSFTSGQAYVALSRCRTLDGTFLASRITGSQLFKDDTLLDFYKKIEECGGVIAPEEVIEEKKEEVINFEDYGL